jgi:hypothetical protein
VKELIEDVFPYLKKTIEAKYRSPYGMNLPTTYVAMKVWTLKEDL